MATTAEIYAQAKRDEAAKQLQNLYDNNESAYTEQKNAATNSTQTLLDRLTQQQNDYRAQSEASARTSYVNKLLGTQDLKTRLNTLGLQNSGYGVSQYNDLNNTYNRNINDIQNTLAKNLTSIDLEKAQAQSDLTNTLADLASKYANNKTSISQYITEQLMNVYNNAYNQKYQEEQDLLAKQQYEDEMKLKREQFEFEKAVTNTKLNQSSSYNSPVYDLASQYINPYTGVTKNLAAIQNYDVFSNGYQPRGISGVGEVSKSGYKVGDLLGNLTGSTGISMAGQNIWKTGSGSNTRYWLWDGSQDSYFDYTEQVRNALGNKLKKNSSKYDYFGINN